MVTAAMFSLIKSLDCIWMHGFAGDSKSVYVIGKVRHADNCVSRCSKHKKAYVEYNFEKRICTCLIDFKGLVSSSENIAVCKAPGNATTGNFDIINFCNQTTEIK